MIVAVDIDIPAGSARVELRCGDRRVTLDARGGRCSTTREIVGFVDSPRRYQGRWQVLLLGRTRHEGIRSGLLWLSTYVAENGSDALHVADVRRALGPLMDVPAAESCED